MKMRAIKIVASLLGHLICCRSHYHELRLTKDMYADLYTYLQANKDKLTENFSLIRA